MLAECRDPREIKKAEADEPTSLTFEAIAREWHSGTMDHPEWKEITRNKILREMENHIFPAIGSKPIDSLKTRDLLPLLISMNEQGIGATTGKVKTTIASVLRYAVQRGIVEYNPAHDLKGALAAQHQPQGMLATYLVH